MTSKDHAARMEYRGRTKNAMTSKGCAARVEYRGRTKNAMTPKGCAARMEYRDEDQCFVGHIAGIRDCVGFHSESEAGLRKVFEEAVEDYLETCAAVGKAPQKPHSGKLTPLLFFGIARLFRLRSPSLADKALTSGSQGP